MSTPQSPLQPIPKVWIPAAAALVVILLSWIISADFGTAELAALLTAIGYFVLAYVLPTDGVGTRGPAAERPNERRFEPLQ